MSFASPMLIAAVVVPTYLSDHAFDILSATVAGVGALLIYYQVKAAKNQLTLMNYTAYTRRYYEIVQRLPPDIYAPDFVLAGREDRDAILKQMRSYFDLSFEEWDLHDRGLIGSSAWTLWSAGISTAVERPAFQQAWTILRESGTYDARFQDYIAEGIAKPAAR